MAAAMLAGSAGVVAVASDAERGEREVAWARSYGGAGSATGDALAVDGRGNSLIVGTFSGSIDVGGTTLTGEDPWRPPVASQQLDPLAQAVNTFARGAASEEVFVAKVDRRGGVVWARSFGGVFPDLGFGIAVDPTGNVLVTGAFWLTAEFGNTTLVAPGWEPDVFIAKLDPAGRVLWARSYGGTGNDAGYGIAVDRAGNAFVTGYFSGTALFGTTPLVALGFHDGFVAKVDLDGNVAWARSFGVARDGGGVGIAVDGAGAAVVTGWAAGLPDPQRGFPLSVFVAKYGGSGDPLWARSYRSVGHGRAVATDASGAAVVTGVFAGSAAFGGVRLAADDGDVFVLKVTPDGRVVWAHRYGGADFDTSMALAVDPAGDVLVTGAYWSTITFGTTTLTARRHAFFGPLPDVFLAKLDAEGTALWADSYGGPLTDVGTGVALDWAGSARVTGWHEGPAEFGTSTLSGDPDDPRNGAGFFEWSAFLAKVGRA